MRKIIAIAAMACIGLAGCTTTSGPVTIGSTPVTVSSVQSAAVTACGFLPVASTVASIIGALSGVGAVVSSAEDIASQICAVVTKTGARRGGARPTIVVNGKVIPISGNFVPK